MDVQTDGHLRPALLHMNEGAAVAAGRVFRGSDIFTVYCWFSVVYVDVFYTAVFGMTRWCHSFGYWLHFTYFCCVLRQRNLLHSPHVYCCCYSCCRPGLTPCWTSARSTVVSSYYHCTRRPNQRALCSSGSAIWDCGLSVGCAPHLVAHASAVTAAVVQGVLDDRHLAPGTSVMAPWSSLATARRDRCQTVDLHVVHRRCYASTSIVMRRRMVQNLFSAASTSVLSETSWTTSSKSVVTCRSTWSVWWRRGTMPTPSACAVCAPTDIKWSTVRGCAHASIHSPRTTAAWQPSRHPASAWSRSTSASIPRRANSCVYAWRLAHLHVSSSSSTGLDHWRQCSLTSCLMCWTGSVHTLTRSSSSVTLTFVLIGPTTQLPDSSGTHWPPMVWPASRRPRRTTTAARWMLSPHVKICHRRTSKSSMSVYRTISCCGGPRRSPSRLQSIQRARVDLGVNSTLTSSAPP